VQAPVFHVNGDDPEACARVIDIAFAFRQTFKKDVVVDMICYRRWGHNEGDEPGFTQPLMYAKIREKRSVRKLYTEKLVNRGDLTIGEAEAALNDFRARLEDAFTATHEAETPEVGLPLQELPPLPVAAPPAVDAATIARILSVMATAPEGFTPHPKLAKHLREHLHEGELLASGEGEPRFDWATGESLAIGTLLLEGRPVRLSGQDTRRGTFSQRHAVLVDQNTGSEWIPLVHLDPRQGPFLLYDSLLSEYAALGFEYGYSVARQDTLVAWEAQFGDFSNGAQIIIDQFIAAAAEKWDQHSRLTLLLPHGLEGQGPEHSSARLERFLQLCARNNLRVTVPTTAVQYYHLLRSQAYLEPATPLVAMTPKSLLRAPAAESPAGAFSTGAFQRTITDPEASSATRLLLLCSGKVAFDLMAHRRRWPAPDTAIVRVEQLYPFPADEIAALLSVLPGVVEARWIQEEPQNMGAWSFVQPQLVELLAGRELRYVGRAANPSPATGSARLHQLEQEHVLVRAFER